MASPLFSGEDALRDPRERLAFVLTLLCALPAAAAIGFVVHEQIGLSEVALFIVIAMLYVTLARGRLIGSSVMIHEAQYPRVFSLVKIICARLDIAMPLIFVREDNYVPVAAVGFGEPYALVLSSHWIEHFEDDELAFAVGRELGHIAAGHTRFLSLLSVNGNENPVISLIFGGWLRTCSRTCDKVGLLACGSLDAATRSIAIASFHAFGRHVDMARLAEQGREIASDSVLRLGEWLGGEPYATRRIADMHEFIATPQYAAARAWYARAIPEEPPALAVGGAHVSRDDCAGPWRRSWSVLIDLVMVSTLLAFAVPHGNPIHASGHLGATELAMLRFGALMAPVFRYVAGPNTLVTAIYLWLLVGFTGQSFGMMIAGLRVVTIDFRARGLGRAFIRYLVAFFLWPIIALCSFFMPRVMLHDRLSGTRLIRAERIMERAVEVRYSSG